MASCQKGTKFDFLVKNHLKLSDFIFVEEYELKSTFFVIDIFEKSIKTVSLPYFAATSMIKLICLIAISIKRISFLEIVTRHLLSDNSFFIRSDYSWNGKLFI